jgi:tetratricopeptide (TPR) repeat protein
MNQTIRYSIRIVIFLILIVFSVLNLAFCDETYQEMLEGAINAYKLGHQEQMAELLKKCVIIEPNNYLAWYWGGMMSESDHAILDFDRAIELAPNEPDSYAMRGCLRLRIAQSVFDSNQIEGMKDILKALSIDPNNIPACYHKAGDLIRAGEYRDAIPYLQRIVDRKDVEKRSIIKTYLFNYQEQSYVSLSRIYKQLQMYDVALNHINNALENALLSKRNEDVVEYYRLRYEINKIVNKENAIKDIDKIIEIAPLFLRELIYFKIDLLIDLKKEEEAVHLNKEILTKIPSDSHEYVLYVHCLGIKLGCLEEAITALEKCEENVWIDNHRAGLIDNDTLRVFYVIRCHLNLKKNRLDCAYDDVTKIILLEPAEPRNYLMRAQILFSLARSNDAQKDMEMFLSLSASPAMLVP